MAYNKRIRGDSHQSNNEEFSHNRITVILGGSGVIAVCFAILLISAAIGWMMLRQGSLLAFLIVASFLALFAGAGIVGTCFVVVRISDMITTIQQNKLLKNTLIVDEGKQASYYDAEWTHLSAILEQARIPQHTTVTEERVDYTDSMITELYDKGLSRRAIAKALDIPYNRIQQLLQGKP